jgi:hypothetical protein
MATTELIPPQGGRVLEIVVVWVDGAITNTFPYAMAELARMSGVASPPPTRAPAHAAEGSS